MSNYGLGNLYDLKHVGRYDMRKQRDKEIIDATHKADMLAIIAVLYDYYDFTGDEIEQFLDTLKEVSDGIGKGKHQIDWKVINENIRDELGITVV